MNQRYIQNPILSLILGLCLTLQAHAGLDSAPLWLGGAAGLSQVRDRHTVDVGLRGAWMAQPYLGVGLWASTLASNVRAYADSVAQSIDYDQMGLFAEPCALPARRVHVCTPILLGAGKLDVVSPRHEDNQSEDWFFVVDMAVNLEWNHSPQVRTGLIGGIRVSRGVEEPGIQDSDLRSFYMGLLLKWGRFGQP